ncbi:MAG: hypothetical protein HXY34_03400 [Candidatus Thorarchaeota archaeon]|nr:hypothetical protein [Candidatus Thorarchaeota archaeon]
MTHDTTSPGTYRDVSDLRTQYFCEYRYYLEQRHGNEPSRAAARGSALHQHPLAVHDMTAPNGPLLILIIVVAIVAAILWIMW